MSVAAHPTQSQIHRGGAVEMGIVSAGAAGDVLLPVYRDQHAGVLTDLESGFTDLGIDVAAGFGASLGALLLRAKIGSGHASRKLLEWGTVAVAAVGAAGYSVLQDGVPRTLAEAGYTATRAITAGATAKLAVNAWLHD